VYVSRTRGGETLAHRFTSFGLIKSGFLQNCVSAFEMPIKVL